MSEDLPKDILEKFEELDHLIQDYFQTWWVRNGVQEPGDYIASWAIVANFANIENGAATGYVVEASPQTMPPHAMKGLFLEGVDWVIDRQAGEGE